MLVRQLAKIAFGFGGHGTMLTMKAAYDGSGKEKDHPVITVAGFFADETICDDIESDWLRATGGKVFHYRTFNTNKCELGSREWNDNQRTAFLKRLGGIVNRNGVEIVSHSVEVSEYKAYLSATKYADVLGPAYSALAQLCCYATEILLQNSGRMREKIAYIFEQGERAHELMKFFS